MKKCPFCAEEVLEEAIKCKHCGSMLNSRAENKQPTEVKVKSSKAKILTSSIVILLLIALIGYFVVQGMRDSDSPTLVVGKFISELRDGNNDTARKLLTSDMSKTTSDDDLDDIRRKIDKETWLTLEDSIIINKDEAVEEVARIRDGQIGKYLIRLNKTYWGWKITGIH